LTTDETITAFNEAFGRHDVNAVMALMTDDCIFENTLPTPDGKRTERSRKSSAT
jgi:ketosteroid isomerase-like protein